MALKKFGIVIGGWLLFTDDELAAVLSEYPTIDKTVIIDSCYAGGFWGDHNPNDAGDLEKSSRTGFLASASEAGKSYYNSSGIPLLSRVLTEGLAINNGYASLDVNPRDGVVTLSEMGELVKEVDRLLRYKGDIVYEMLFGDPVIFTTDLLTPEYIATADFDEMLVEVETPTDPVAVIAFRPPLACIESGTTELVLDGTASVDPEGDPLTYTWTGPFGTLEGERVTATVPAGTHKITLTVDDGNGGVDSDTVEITVEACPLNCDIDENGKFDGRDFAAFMKGCGRATVEGVWCKRNAKWQGNKWYDTRCPAEGIPWLCDVNGDGSFNGRDVAAYQKQCKVR